MWKRCLPIIFFSTFLNLTIYAQELNSKDFMKRILQIENVFLGVTLDSIKKDSLFDTKSLNRKMFPLFVSFKTSLEKKDSSLDLDKIFYNSLDGMTIAAIVIPTNQIEKIRERIVEFSKLEPSEISFNNAGDESCSTSFWKFDFFSVGIISSLNFVGLVIYNNQPHSFFRKVE
jgi:hypothetical protein